MVLAAVGDCRRGVLVRTMAWFCIHRHVRPSIPRPACRNYGFQSCIQPHKCTGDGQRRRERKKQGRPSKTRFHRNSQLHATVTITIYTNCIKGDGGSSLFYLKGKHCECQPTFGHFSAARCHPHFCDDVFPLHRSASQ